MRESDALLDATGVEQQARDPAVYGQQKAACEAAVLKVFGARATIVRPGLVIGPSDPTGRFSYWPWRAMAGGAMLVPAMSADTPLQLIDARDLGAFMVGLVEREVPGVFNAVGPAPAASLTWPMLIAGCLAAAAKRGAPSADVRQVAEARLTNAGVAPWTGLPVWLPSTDLSYTGLYRVDNSAAIAAGLVTRPLATTIADIIDEGVPPPDDARRVGKLTPALEAILIAESPDQPDAPSPSSAG